MVREKSAVYPLSADPIHNGHIYTLAVAANSGLFDKVIVAVGNDCNKNYLFDLDERLFLAKKAVYSSGFEKNKVSVESFYGLLRNYAREQGAKFIVRGCRNSKDWEYEKILGEFNGEYGLQTLIFPASKEFENLSSTYVKSIAAEGGFVHNLVHPSVKQALEERLREVSLIGVTGNMGAGKTTFCEKLVEYSQLNGGNLSHIDFDKLVHSLYFGDSSLSYEVRKNIRASFGEDVFNSSGLDRRKLAEIVFGDSDKREELSRILMVPSMIKFEEELRQRKGIVLVDAAYFTEYNLLPLVNYNVILVSCDENERFRRVFRRDGINREEIEAKTKAQHSEDLKRKIIREAQDKYNHGFFHEIDSTNGMRLDEIMEKIESYFPLLKSGVRENAIV
ncbi:MAG: pantetheine-phosphate adenylyltransferase [Candidatus Nanoarchaeia archaeon]|nr:pantetheine-phosphate adenylyltransferase [Candidatus Nanoarchaeia archaeon]MDD5740369.1 pantetheine-phosphate adenylyltransferase [Candidatus Nanoarchaeia archaeon]